MEQLKANELRIGNFVLDDTSDNVMIVSRIENKDYTEWNSGGKYNICCLKFGTKGYYEGNFKPIQLTKEWLKKFDYKPHPMFNLSYQDIGSSTNCPQWGFVFIGFARVETKIYYVHQLQNLYFALTLSLIHI